MIIINAVGCTNSNVRAKVVKQYLNNNNVGKILTDDEVVYNRLHKRYKDRIVYHESLVSLWFRVKHNDIIMLSKFSNVDSIFYYDIVNNFNVISVEEGCCVG